MGDPKVGDRRPREGRCDRCDRPLTDEVFIATCPCGCGAKRARWDDADADSASCAGGWRCDGPAVDWRARALAAEAALAEVREVLADPDMGALVDHGLAGDVATRLHATVDAALAHGREHFLDGAQHGLLAAAMRLSDLACACGPAWTGRGMHSPDCVEWMVDELAELAKETP